MSFASWRRIRYEIGPMAADKTTKRKRRDTAGETTSEGGSSPREQDDLALRQRTDPRQERRYEPKIAIEAVLTIVAVALGAALAGAGTYGQWFRAETLGPHKLSPYLLGAGAALLIGVAVFGHLSAKPIRVGDAGVGLEKDPAEIDRIPWYAVTRLALTPAALTVHSSGTFITIPLRAHAPAAARALAEARARIPARVHDIPEGKLPTPDDAAGEVLPLDPPQAAGQRCKATDKLIAFERDARFCGRCGELYHKDGIPKRCLTCDARLRR